MNYGKLKKIFFLLLAGGLLFRLISVVFTIDGKTGFINPDYFASGILLSVLSLACVIASAVMSFLCKETGNVKVKGGAVSGVLALLISGLSIVDILAMQYSSYFPTWQISVVIIMGVLNAVFFLYYAIMIVLGVKILPGLYVIPLLFSIIKLIRFFAITSSITIITDNIFAVLYYSLAVLFMLELVSVANNITGRAKPKILLATGLSASMLSVINSVPRIIKLLSDSSAVAHESVYSLALSLVLGLFIMTLTLKSFKD